MWAGEIGLDLARFKKEDIASPEVKQRIDTDKQG
jgi:hypothetical protein